MPKGHNVECSTRANHTVLDNLYTSRDSSGGVHQARKKTSAGLNTPILCTHGTSRSTQNPTHDGSAVCPMNVSNVETILQVEVSVLLTLSLAVIELNYSICK